MNKKDKLLSAPSMRSNILLKGILICILFLSFLAKQNIPFTLNMFYDPLVQVFIACVAALIIVSISLKNTRWTIEKEDSSYNSGALASLSKREIIIGIIITLLCGSFAIPLIFFEGKITAQSEPIIVLSGLAIVVILAITMFFLKKSKQQPYNQATQQMFQKQKEIWGAYWISKFSIIEIIGIIIITLGILTITIYGGIFFDQSWIAPAGMFFIFIFMLLMGLHKKSPNE